MVHTVFRSVSLDYTLNMFHTDTFVQWVNMRFIDFIIYTKFNNGIELSDCVLITMCSEMDPC